MRIKAFFGIIFMALLGCQPKNTNNNHQSNELTSQNEMPKEIEIIPPAQQPNSIFVAHLPKLEKMGNAALFTGTLNNKNGCLYIDDYLLVVAGIYVKWQNEPFWIGNSQGEQFQLGDRVSLGGSQIDYNTMYDNSLNKKCKADKIWLTHGVTKPL